MKVNLWRSLSPLQGREVRWYAEMVKGQGVESEPLVLEFVRVIAASPLVLV